MDSRGLLRGRRARPTRDPETQGGKELGADRRHPRRSGPKEHPESGRRAGYSGAKRTKGSEVHLAVNTLDCLLAIFVTPADVDERKAVAELAKRIQEETGDSVELAYVDQGYTGPDPAKAAEEHGIALGVVKLPEAKRGFVLLPRRWVVERSFAWSSRIKRLAKDYERLPETLARMHVLAFCTLMLGALGAWIQGA